MERGRKEEGEVGRRGDREKRTEDGKRGFMILPLPSSILSL
jgi:hypothetical protein